MHTQIKNSFLFYTFTLFICLNAFFIRDTAAQASDEPCLLYTSDAADEEDSVDLGLDGAREIVLSEFAIL